MQIQVLLGGARVAAILTHIEFVSTLLVGILLLHAVDLLQVGLQGAPLGEGFVTHITFVGADACKDEGQTHHQLVRAEPKQPSYDAIKISYDQDYCQCEENGTRTIYKGLGVNTNKPKTGGCQ